jgi:class 3 adenylate cyclase
VATVDDFIAAGLYDPGTSPEGRLELLEWLDAEGFSVDEMKAGQESMSLGAMSGDRRLIGTDRLTREQAIEMSGLGPDRFDAMATAFGFTSLDPMPGMDTADQWSVSEATTLMVLGQLALMFSEEEAVGIVRVIGSSISRIADAAVSMFLNDVESPLVVTGASELEVAKKVHEAIGLLDGLSEQLDPVLRRHVLQAIQRSRRANVDFSQRFSFRYAIGFVDLVGFTEISGNFDAQRLGAFIRDFEGRAHDVVTAQGARVVKLIGDEIMFVSTDADAACRAASALMEGFGNDVDRVVPRGGLAWGDVLARGGDYYGSVVNLASRLVDEAVPQEVLVTEELARAATRSSFEPAGRRMVKGFDHPVVVRSLVAGS